MQTAWSVAALVAVVRADLYRIAAHTEQSGRREAVLSGIESTIDSLPESWRLHPYLHDVADRYRCAAAPFGYVVVFTVREHEHRIFVAAIAHGREDIDVLLHARVQPD